MARPHPLVGQGRHPLGLAPMPRADQAAGTGGTRPAKVRALSPWPPALLNPASGTGQTRAAPNQPSLLPFGKGSQPFAPNLFPLRRHADQTARRHHGPPRLAPDAQIPDSITNLC